MKSEKGNQRILRTALCMGAILIAVMVGCLLSMDTVNAANKKSLKECTVKLSYTKATYSGKALEPGVTVTKPNKKKLSDKYYTVTYSNNTDPGKATVKVTGTDKYTGTVKKTFEINVGAPTKLAAKYSGGKDAGADAGIKLTWTAPKACTGYTITISKDRGSFKKKTVKTGETSYQFTGLEGPGIFTFKVRAYAGPENTKSDSLSVKVIAGQIEQTITTKASKFCASKGKSISIGASAKTKLTYTSSDKSIATVSSAGKISFKGNGTAKITVKAKETSSYQPATRKVTVTSVVPSRRIGEAAGNFDNKSPTIGTKKNGDGNGKEVRIQKWYYTSATSYCSWTHVLRFKNPKLAESAAKIMEDACANDRIGYDHSSKTKSLSFYYALKKNKWDATAIDGACYTACSQMIAACIRGACKRNKVTPNKTVRIYVSALGMYNNLKTTGLFEIYTDKDHLQTDVNLQRGDILVTAHSNGKDNHTCMVLD